MTAAIADAEIAEIIAGYRLPDEIPFGVEMPLVMYRAEFVDR